MSVDLAGQPEPLRVGLFGIGLNTYWGQLPGLEERLKGYTSRVAQKLARRDVEVVNLGLIDTPEKDWDQPWTRAIPDQSAIIDWAKRVNHFRAGIGRDYLVYGRMLRPWRVSKVTGRDFGWGKEPLVQSATWQAPNGRIAVVLANCADLGESPRVELEGRGSKKLSLYIDGRQKEQQVELPNVIDLDMLPRSLAMIEVE